MQRGIIILQLKLIISFLERDERFLLSSALRKCTQTENREDGNESLLKQVRYTARLKFNSEKRVVWFFFFL